MSQSKPKVLSGQEVADRCLRTFEGTENNWKDPSAWEALFFDRSVPFEVGAKAVYVRQCETHSRQFLLPLIRPFCRAAIMLIQVWKAVFPNFPNSSKTLHYLVYLGQKYLVSPETNYLILRHFNIGTRVIRFLSANWYKASEHLVPLEPKELKTIYEKEIYVQHDINLFNFVIGLGRDMRQNKMAFKPKSNLDFSMIDLNDFGIKDLPNRWHNFLDLETAIELYTPIFYFFLRDKDFWRAHHSLQFDETMAVYLAEVLGNDAHLALVNNKHPMMPRPGYEAAPRLVLHGISSEYLYGMLAAYKRRHDNPDQSLPMTFNNQLVFGKPGA